MKLQNLNLNLNWNCRRILALGALLALAATNPTLATERAFTFTYEPETMPEGATEVEQWVSLAAGRRDLVGGVNDQKNYHRWEFRTELEYGVSDIYQVSLYLNAQHESFRDATGMNLAKTEFKGVLEKLGKSVEELHAYADAHPEMKRALYRVPKYKGVIGTAANFAIHTAERMGAKVPYHVDGH
ncbi:MAG: hypothetical protein HY301_11465 [Verrucomicrobia bacterium]|nr:hypothetical protein [Verrucomicrobiota bacterium]